MSNDADEILRRYMEKVLQLRQERDIEHMGQEELRQIALESGMTESDLAYVEQRFLEYVNRGEGFLRYSNWDDAIMQFEEAIILVPHNTTVLNALATAYWNKSRLDNDEDLSELSGMEARAYAEKVLTIDPQNDQALRLLTAMRREETAGDASATQSTVQTLSPTAAKKVMVIVLAAVALAVIGVGVAMFLIVGGGTQDVPVITPDTPSETESGTVAEAPVTDPTKDDTPPDTGFARLAQEFGSEGIGAGMFTDARSIASDGNGRIYVGEYSSGRIQVFDSAGTFITQWNIGEKRYVKSLAADRDGMVYVAYSGGLHRFDGATGEKRGELRYSKGPGFTNATTAADGGVVAAWDGNWRGGIMINPEGKDDIVRFDRNGKMVKAIRNAISGAADEFEMQTRLAVDGLGNIYALGTMTNAVYKFSPEGKFITKFGGSGRGAGKFSHADAITVDGQGNVYVGSWPGIHVFDPDGGYLGTIEARGAISGLVFNNRGELLVVARTKVMRYVLRK